MAKKAAAPGNKSQAIREALAAHPDKSPKEITEVVTALGFKVTPSYVSIIKYNLSKAAGKKNPKTVRRKIRRSSGRGAADAGSHLGAMQAAVDFVRSAGGLDQAKQALSLLESIRESL